jgi:hypothetical protein
MPTSIGDRYKLILEEHRFASEYRLKIVQGWCLTYAAFAAAFGWVYVNAKGLSYAVSLAALVATVLSWAADIRHRSSLHVLKTVGTRIEQDPSAAIPESQRYFAHVKRGLLSHSLMIDLAGGCAIGVLLPASWFLYNPASKLASARGWVVLACVIIMDLLVFAVDLSAHRRHSKEEADRSTGTHT